MTNNDAIKLSEEVSTLSENANIVTQNEALPMKVMQGKAPSQNRCLEACDHQVAPPRFVRQEEQQDYCMVNEDVIADISTAMHSCKQQEDVIVKHGSCKKPEIVVDQATHLRDDIIIRNLPTGESGKSSSGRLGPLDPIVAGSSHDKVWSAEHLTSEKLENNPLQEKPVEETSLQEKPVEKNPLQEKSKDLMGQNIEEDEGKFAGPVSSSLESGKKISTVPLSALVNVEDENLLVHKGLQVTREQSDYVEVQQDKSAGIPTMYSKRRNGGTEQDNSSKRRKIAHVPDIVYVSEPGGAPTEDLGESLADSVSKGEQLPSIGTRSSLEASHAVPVSAFDGDLVEMHGNAEVWTEQLQFADSCLTFSDSIIIEHEQDKISFQGKSPDRSNFSCETSEYLQLKVPEAIGPLLSEVPLKSVTVIKAAEKIVQESEVQLRQPEVPSAKDLSDHEEPFLETIGSSGITSETVDNASQAKELDSNIPESVNVEALPFKDDGEGKKTDLTVPKTGDLQVNLEYISACSAAPDAVFTGDAMLNAATINSAGETNLCDHKKFEGTMQGVANTIVETETPGLLTAQDKDHSHFNTEESTKIASLKAGAVLLTAGCSSEALQGEGTGSKIEDMKHQNTEDETRMTLVPSDSEKCILAISASDSAQSNVMMRTAVVSEQAGLEDLHGQGAGFKAKDREHQNASGDARIKLTHSDSERCMPAIGAPDFGQLEVTMGNAVMSEQADEGRFSNKTHVAKEYSEVDTRSTMSNISHVVPLELKNSDQFTGLHLEAQSSSFAKEQNALSPATEKVMSPPEFSKGLKDLETNPIATKDVTHIGEGLNEPGTKPSGAIDVPQIGEGLKDPGTKSTAAIDVPHIGEVLENPGTNSSAILVPPKSLLSHASGLRPTRQPLFSPDLNIQEVPLEALLGHRPVTDSQQVQLRSQILVYGALLQGLLPDESYMVGAFMDTTAAMQESGKEQARTMWANSWQAAAKSQNKFMKIKTHIPVLPSTSALPSGLLDATSKVPIATSSVSVVLPSMLPSAIRSPVLDVRFSTSAGLRSFPISSGVEIPLISTFGTRSSLAAPLQTSSNVFSAAVSTAMLHAETTRRLTGFQAPFTEPWQWAVGSYVLHPQIPPFSVPSTSAAWWSSSSYLRPPVPASELRNAASVPGSAYTMGHTPQDDAAANMGSSLQLLSPFVGSTIGSSISMSSADPAKNGKDARARRTTRLLETRSRKRLKSDSFELSLVSEVASVHDKSKESSFLQMGPNKECIDPPATEGYISSIAYKDNSSEPLSLSKGVEVAGNTTPISHLEGRNTMELIHGVGQSSQLQGPSNSTVETPMSLSLIALSSCPTTLQEIVPSSNDTSLTLQNKGGPAFACRPDDSTIEAGKLEEAKVLAENIEATASSALQLSQSFWSELSSHTNADAAANKEAEIAFLAATITAAITAVKAAAAAGKVAYEAAIQAKDIVSEVLKRTHSTLSVSASEYLTESQANTMSCIDNAKKAAAERVEAASLSTKKARILDGVVQAVDLAAKAASQAGAIITLGDPIPFSLRSLREGGVDAFLESRSTISAKRPGLDLLEGIKTSQQDTVMTTMEIDGLLPSIGLEAGASSQKEELERSSRRVTAKKIGKDATGMEIKKTKDTQKMGKNSQRENPRISTTSMTATKRSEAITAVAELILEAEEEKSRKTRENTLMEQEKLSRIVDDMKEGIAVEVIQEEDGIREGWFKARVLKVEDGKVLVVYDDLYDDDEDHQLEDWVPLPTCLDDAPRVRLLKDDGNRKRRRSTIGNQMWLIGDHVDALLNDGWWEGIVKCVNEEDEKLVTVRLLDGEAVVMKSWNLRPALTWRDGCWVPWTVSRQDISEQEDAGTAVKRQKIQKGHVDVHVNDKAKLLPTTKSGVAGKGTSKEKPANDIAPGLDDKNLPERSLSTKGVSMLKRNKKILSQKDSNTKGTNRETSKVVFGVPKPTKKRKSMVDIAKAQPMDIKGTKSLSKNKKEATLEKALLWSRDRKKREQGAGEAEVRADKKEDMLQAKLKAKNPKIDKDRPSSARTSPSVATNVSTHGMSTKSSNLVVKKKQANSGVTRDPSSHEAGVSTTMTVQQKPAKSLPYHFRKQLENLDRLQQTREKADTGGSETDDFRRSRRMLQPSFKLLEGLQSSPKTSK
ncbi:hypothetical protein O6H91_13G105500 [Diphasiastrum complanatum]|nr:hypothetical protein O6H91_13G105500 [Diphasiastrum complanatum]KAJ7534693.1 hypothetical protein O6H91_13G105500 [Diphasiastrum complanatum]